MMRPLRDFSHIEQLSHIGARGCTFKLGSTRVAKVLDSTIPRCPGRTVYPSRTVERTELSTNAHDATAEAVEPPGALLPGCAWHRR